MTSCYHPLPLPFAALAFGRCPRTRRDVDALIAHGVTHIIDCAGSKVAAGIVDKRISYAPHPIPDTLDYLPAWWFEKVGRAALRILGSPASRLVVCCTQGRRRSPALVYWLLRERGLDAAGAEAALRTARTSVAGVYFASAEAAVVAV